MTKPIWKAVVGYAGFYEVSEFGQVRSLPRIDNRGHKRGGFIMTPRVEKSGYLSLALCNFGKVKRRKVHHLVIEAFVGLRPTSKLQCRHLDDNKLNNFWRNLVWGTAKANKEDAQRNDKIARGEANGGGNSLKETDVREIKRLLSEGERGTTVAELFGVTKGMIYHIAKGRAWAHVH